MKNSMNPDFWRGKRVFLTGHTGFKGAWLSLWLAQMGAKVCGYALQPPTQPSLFELARIGELMESHIADVRDLPRLTQVMSAFRPDVAMHLAAQPLVRLSYETPVDTYSTNVMGTVNFLEAARATPSAKAVLVITSDKCYRNIETIWSYRENDPMGGDDPYSNSKGCAELVTHAYGRSYFSKNGQALASVRAGNVIGGGDWAKDRLMTDIIAALIRNEKPVIRRPRSVRPWQHVLEPLSGYLAAAEHIYATRPDAYENWNFGPVMEDEVDVETVARTLCRLWGPQADIDIREDKALHEAGLLKLDSTKAHLQLNWRPRWRLATALAKTAEWYKRLEAKADMRDVTLDQITEYQDANASASIKEMKVA
jgi:CDP-glucose 4,6-dehydratase